MTKSLRIAVFAYEFPALSETFVINQVTGLIDRGHDVTVFAERPRDEHVVHGQVSRYELDRRTCYLQLPSSRAARVLKGMVLLLGHAGRGIRPLLRSLNFVRYGRDALSLRLLFWSARTVGRGQFDIIHCHFGSVGRLALILRDIGAIDGKISTVFHGVDVSAALRASPDMYNELFERGDLFLPVSDAWRRKLTGLGCNPHRTAVHHMGVETRSIPSPPKDTGHDAVPILLTVGRMVEKKGMEFGLRAVAELARRNIPLHYSIVGDGILRPRLEALAEQLRISHLVTFYGWQPRDAVQKLVSTSDILLAPSVTDSIGDQEGIPVSLMEAMAAGVPVVSTRHSGIPELVVDGISGILVEERDWKALADATERLLHDPQLRTKLSDAARERVAQAFDIETLNTALEQRFFALVGEDAGT